MALLVLTICHGHGRLVLRGTSITGDTLHFDIITKIGQVVQNEPIWLKARLGQSSIADPAKRNPCIATFLAYAVPADREHWAVEGSKKRLATTAAVVINLDVRWKIHGNLNQKESVKMLLLQLSSNNRLRCKTVIKSLMKVKVYHKQKKVPQ